MSDIKLACDVVEQVKTICDKHGNNTGELINIPKGKHPISVCMGTACYVRGSEKLLEEFKRVLGIEVGETTPDGKYSLDCLRCVGACGLAPVVMIGEKVYGRLQPVDVKKIIEELE